MPLFRLHDDKLLVLRALQPDDRDAFLHAFHDLSERSRYLRFHQFNPQLRDRDIAYLTQVDQCSHVALAAFDRTSGVALGRFVRLTETPGIADLALTVLDAWQRRGLGTLMLAALMHRAVEVGVSEFSASVLLENRAARTMMQNLEAGGKQEGTVTIFTLPCDASQLPESRLADTIRSWHQVFTRRDISFAPE